MAKNKKPLLLNRSSSWPVKNKPTIWNRTYRQFSDGTRKKYKMYDEVNYWMVVYPVLDKKSGKIVLVGRNGGDTFAEACAFMQDKIKQVIADVDNWHPPVKKTDAPENKAE